MLQEGMAVEETACNVPPQGPATQDAVKPTRVEMRPYYRRSGQYLGRREGEGEDELVWKNVQDAVALLKAIPDACDVTKTKNDPFTAAVIMTVGIRQDRYWNCDRMCAQLPGVFTIAELTMEPGRQGVFIFDNSTGHGAFEDNSLLANHIAMKPGGEQPVLEEFKDDAGNSVNPVFREDDTLHFKTQVFARKTEADRRNQPKCKTGESLGTFPKNTAIEKGKKSECLIGLPKGAKQLLMEIDLWEGSNNRPGSAFFHAKCVKMRTKQPGKLRCITDFNRGGEGR